MREYITDPVEIERKSMEIIESELGERIQSIPMEMRRIIKRVIHTTADFEYADLLEWSDDFLAAMTDALKRKRPVITDTTMIQSGLNKRVLQKEGIECDCLIRDPEAVALAKAEGITRSMAALRCALQRYREPILIVGNAPTTLFQLEQMVEDGECPPACVVGVPVGFVGAAESKESVRALGVPYIVTRGRKGGSTVAVAIVNAILYELYGNVAP